MKTYPQPDPKTQTIARTFSYTTFGLLIGAMIYLMTNNLISLTLRADWFGTVALVGFGLIYGNVSFFIARRYMRKPYTFNSYPYIISTILLLPALILIRIKSDIFFNVASEITFFGMILVGVMVGAYYGIKKGVEMREEKFQAPTA